MGGFLYFLPERKAADCQPAELARLGLGYAFPGKPQVRECTTGPNGRRGVVLAMGSTLGYFKDRQEWRRIPPRCLPADAAQEVWVGYCRDERPTPAELARPQQLAGHAVTLADGGRWLAPTAICVDEHQEQLRLRNRLPAASRLSEEGEWIASGNAPQYQRLWEIAEAFFAAWSQAGVDNHTLKFDFHGLHEAAIEALAVNYVVGPTECDLLSLLDQRCAVEVLKALIDVPTLLAWTQKKTAQAPATGSSAPGHAA